jgi:hypothetical protein
VGFLLFFSLDFYGGGGTQATSFLGQFDNQNVHAFS